MKTFLPTHKMVSLGLLTFAISLPSLFGANISGDTVTTHLTVNGNTTGTGWGWFKSNHLYLGANKELDFRWAATSDTVFTEISRPSGRLLWRQDVANSAENKMYLDENNNLFLYKSDGNTAGVTLDPQAGSIYLSGTSGGIYLNNSPLIVRNSGGVVNLASIQVAGDSYINGVRIGLGSGGVASNLVFGAGGLNSNSTGSNNSAFGVNSMGATTTGSHNSSFGNSALMANTSGDCNTAFGVNALTYNITGSFNVGLGTTAGAFLSNDSPMTAAQNSIFIGANSKGGSTSPTNAIVIGANAVSAGSNTTVLGNDQTTETYLRGKTFAGSLDVAGETVLKGAVRLAAPQGDISMGIYQ